MYIASHPSIEQLVRKLVWCVLPLASAGGSWSDLYYFRQDATTAADIEMVSYYTKREHAMFTKSHVVTKPTDDGRLTLYDYTLKTKKQGEVTGCQRATISVKKLGLVGRPTIVQQLLQQKCSTLSHVGVHIMQLDMSVTSYTNTFVDTASSVDTRASPV